jgi:signal transduction histidine kinase
MSRDARLERFGVLQAALGALRAEVECALDTEPGSAALPALRDRLRALETAAGALHRTAEDDFKHFGHELRTPLNAMAGWGQLLRADSTTPATVSQAADVVDRSVAALTRTIEAYTGGRSTEGA